MDKVERIKKLARLIGNTDDSIRSIDVYYHESLDALDDSENKNYINYKFVDTAYQLKSWKNELIEELDYAINDYLDDFTIGIKKVISSFNSDVVDSLTYYGLSDIFGSKIENIKSLFDEIKAFSECAHN